MQKNVIANQITLEIMRYYEKMRKWPQTKQLPCNPSYLTQPVDRIRTSVITKPDNMYGQLIIYSFSDITERTRITKYPVMSMTP